MYGTQNFTVICIVADVDQVYVEMICEIKTLETPEAKLSSCVCVVGWGRMGWDCILGGALWFHSWNLLDNV